MLLADLGAQVQNYQVQNYSHRALLGLAIPPDFPTGDNSVYVLYAYDAAIRGTAPRWCRRRVKTDPSATGEI